MKKILILLFICISFHAFSIDFYGVYPSHWWTGMKNSKLQLILHGENAALFTKVTINYSGVKVDKITKLESKNYIIADLTISSTAKPGKFKIILSGGGLPNEDVNYELKAKSNQNGISRVKGVTSEDLIYLIMPDRFSNDDPSNDFFEDMRDKAHDRNNPFDRHGGDLLGVQNHLDYLKDLGVTAIWMTPVVKMI